MCDECGKYYSRVNEQRHLNSFTHIKNAARTSGNKEDLDKCINGVNKDENEINY